MLGIGEHKRNLDQLGRLKRPAANGNPRAGVHAAAALDLLAEQCGVDHQENREACQQIPEIGQFPIVHQGNDHRAHDA